MCAIEAATGKQVVFQALYSDWVMGTSFCAMGRHLVSVSRARSVKLTEVASNRFIDNAGPASHPVRSRRLVCRFGPTHRMGDIPARQPVGIPNEPNPVVEAYNIHMYTVPRVNLRPRDITDVPVKPYDEILVAGADGQLRLYKMHREVKCVIGDDSNKLREYEKMPGALRRRVRQNRRPVRRRQQHLTALAKSASIRPTTPRRVSTFENAKSPIYALAFHPNGRIVASAGFDGLVHLHEPLTGKLIKEFVPVPMK